MREQAEHPVRGLLFLCGKFLVFVVPATVLWWLVLPYYAWVLVQVTGGILRLGLGEAIEYGRVEVAGILNTSSMLILGVEGVPRKMAVALLVTNVPPFVALVLATDGLGWRRRLKILAIGNGILAVGHVAFIVYSLHFLGVTTAREVPAIPMAVLQFYLTLPFLLWLVLAYWERLAGYLGEAGKE